MLCLIALFLLLGESPPTYAASDVSVYSDSLNSNWWNGSWGTTLNLNNSTPVQSGSASVAATYSAAYGGVYFGTNGALSASDYVSVRFWIHGGSAGGQQIAFKVIDGGNGNWDHSVAVTPQANTWSQVTVNLTSVDSPATIAGLVWQDSSNGPQPTFYIDNVSLIAAPSAPLALSVDVTANRHAISPYIYGMNFADESLAAELHLPVRRYGGNATTRYNWQNDTSNHASDWYFENIPNDNPNPAQLPNGSASDLFVEQDRRTGTKTVMTVPLIGWTPKSRDYACGFSVAKYGAQDATDPWRPDCGNGVHGGANVNGNNPLDTSTAITSTFVQSWMQHFISRYGSAAGGGVMFYNLDNEPMLWNSTHRDVHPSPTSYDEMRDRTYEYAAAIKATDPTAKTLGPVEWGWTGYFYSALDAAPGGAWWNNPLDRLAHGNVPFVEWYLQQLRAYEQQHGTRILDYLDLHYYPQANDVALQPAGDANTQALRLRSTRSLWDPTYTDESWIAQPVYLIPRMHTWADTDYPGTKIAVTEYNWGALEHINGALAQADVLGIFGRESLDLATLWDPPTASQPGAFAFRIYRNYDGAGRIFGDLSVRAASTDQSQLAIYAAQRSGDNALTVLVINKTTGALATNISLAGFLPATNAQVYRYAAANLSAIVHLPDQAVTSTGFAATFPASSITLFVLAPSSALTPRVYLPVLIR